MERDGTVALRLRYWGSSRASLDGNLCEEPHRLLLDAARCAVVRQCRCEGCLFLDRDAAARMGTPLEEALGNAEEFTLDDLVAAIEAEAPAQVRLWLTPEMVLPMDAAAGGGETMALQWARELQDRLRALDIELHLLVPEPLPPETWVRVRADDFELGPENLLLEGMLGQVVLSEWSHAICTPGVSEYVRIVGRKEPVGIWCSALEVLEEAPSAVLLEQSRSLCHSAVHVFQERAGWQGLLQVGDKPTHEQRVRRDIRQLLRQLPALATPGREKERKGNMARLAKLLQSFDLHPAGASLVALATELVGAQGGRPLVEVAEQIEAWMAANPSVEEPPSRHGAAARALAGAASVSSSSRR